MTQPAAEALLEPKLVGTVSGRFYVPAYQRGYRWGAHEVRKLLDDIWESRDRPYYLQPLVVLPLGDEWELVDGQQRLTTLFLIYQFMADEGLKSSGARWTIRYETRDDLAEYLTSLDAGRSDENIDFFHVHEAYQCIRAWFAEVDDDAQYVADKLYVALREQVRVIWYEAPGDVDATTLFTRLNVGRIVLTDAELVKAMLLAELGKLPGPTNPALQTAVEWDTIERDLRDPELWAFITGLSSGVATHLDLLLDSLAGVPSGGERLPFRTFDALRERIASDPEAFWGKVVHLHALVMGWHDSRDLFHKIGYLVRRGATSLDRLVPLANDRPKSEFEAVLDGMIHDDLGLTADELRDLEYQGAKAERVLLLMNVETIRRRVHSTERFSFRELASGRWSLEHIHAQNAKQLPRRADVWATWLTIHRRALAGLDVPAESKVDLMARIDHVIAPEQAPVKGTNFDALEREITAVLSAGGDATGVAVDSIANLALLDGGDNSALSNSVFAVKRNEILERDRNGSFIPVCTRDVFLKYYSPGEEHQAHFWSIDDRSHYLAAMVKTVSAYLSPGEVQP